MLHRHDTRPALSITHYPAYDTRFGLVPEKTCITTGYVSGDWWVHGTRAGDDLRIFFGGCLVDLDPGIVSHQDAVAFCVRQFGRTEGRVAA